MGGASQRLRAKRANLPPLLVGALMIVKGDCGWRYVKPRRVWIFDNGVDSGKMFSVILCSEDACKVFLEFIGRRRSTDQY